MITIPTFRVMRCGGIPDGHWVYILRWKYRVSLTFYYVHAATNMFLSWKHFCHVLIHHINFRVGWAQYDTLTQPLGVSDVGLYIIIHTTDNVLVSFFDDDLNSKVTLLWNHRYLSFADIMATGRHDLSYLCDFLICPLYVK